MQKNNISMYISLLTLASHEVQTMFLSPLLHVSLLFFWEAQKTKNAVLEWRNFELNSKILIVCMKIPEKDGKIIIIWHQYLQIWDGVQKKTTRYNKFKTG